MKICLNNLETATIPELLQYCRDTGLTGYSKAHRAGKKALVEWIYEQYALKYQREQDQRDIDRVLGPVSKADGVGGPVSEEAGNSDGGSVKYPNPNFPNYSESDLERIARLKIGDKVQILSLNPSVNGKKGLLTGAVINTAWVEVDGQEILVDISDLFPVAGSDDAEEPVSEAGDVEEPVSVEDLVNTYRDICSVEPKLYDRVWFGCGCKGAIYSGEAETPFVSRSIFCQRHAGGTVRVKLPQFMTMTKDGHRLWLVADEPVPVSDDKAEEISLPGIGKVETKTIDVSQCLRIGGKVKIRCKNPCIDGKEGILLGVEDTGIARIGLPSGKYQISISALSPVGGEISSLNPASEQTKKAWSKAVGALIYQIANTPPSPEFLMDEDSVLQAATRLLVDTCFN